MRAWFLSLLEIVVVGNVLAEVVFITGLNYRYNIIWKENDEYAVNKMAKKAAVGMDTKIK